MRKTFTDTEIAHAQGWIGMVYDCMGFCNGGQNYCRVRRGNGAPGIWCRIPDELVGRGEEVVSRLKDFFVRHGWMGNHHLANNVTIRLTCSGRCLRIEWADDHGKKRSA